MYYRILDNWIDILNIEVDELTKYILSNFEKNKACFFGTSP